MKQVTFKIDLHSVEHLFGTYRSSRHSQYTGIGIKIDHLLYGFSPYFRPEMMKLVDNDMIRLEFSGILPIQDQCLKSPVGNLWHRSADCFFDLLDDRHVGSYNQYIVCRVIHDIPGNQVRFSRSGCLYDSSDTVRFKPFFNCPVSSFIM